MDDERKWHRRSRILIMFGSIPIREESKNHAVYKDYSIKRQTWQHWHWIPSPRSPDVHHEVNKTNAPTIVIRQRKAHQGVRNEARKHSHPHVEWKWPNHWNVERGTSRLSVAKLACSQLIAVAITISATTTQHWWKNHSSKYNSKRANYRRLLHEPIRFSSTSISIR